MGTGTYFYVFILVAAGIFFTVIGLIPMKGIPITADLPKEQYEKCQKTINRFVWVMRILKFGIMITAIWYILIPFALDIPCMIKQNYPIVSGTVVGKFNDAKGTTIDVKSKSTGKIINIDLIGGGAELSDEVEIIYFPHQKIGNVVK